VMLAARHFAQALRVGDGDRTPRRFGAGDDVAQTRPLAAVGDEYRAHRFGPLAQTRDDGVKAVEGSGRGHAGTVPIAASLPREV